MGITGHTLTGFAKNASYSPLFYFDEQFIDTFSIPEHWTDSIIILHHSYCEDQIKRQLIKYSLLLNTYMNNPTEKIIFPNEEDLKKI